VCLAVGDDRLGADAPDVVFSPTFEPWNYLITLGMRETPGLDGTTLMFPDSSLQAYFPGDVDFFAGRLGFEPGAAAGVLMAGNSLAYRDRAPFKHLFAPLWRERYGEAPPDRFPGSDWAPHAFDAYMLGVAALERVARPCEDGSLRICRRDINDVVRGTDSGHPMHHNGVTGNLKADSNGDCGSGEVDVLEITGGRFLVVERYDFR